LGVGVKDKDGYNGSTMPETGRKILFFLFVSGFIVFAPVVVLYTAGYRYSLQSGRFVQTGILSATSIPKDAGIFLDGERLKSKTPAIAKNILPGEHLVRIEKDGYLPWIKRLSFYSQVTTFIHKAVLFLDQPALQVHEARASESAAFPYGQKIAYAKQEGRGQEIWTFKTDGTQTLIARIPLVSPAPKMHWSADGAFLSLQTPLRNGFSTSLVDANSGEVIRLPSASEKDGWWDASVGSRYYTSTALGVSQFTLASRTAATLPRNTLAATSDGASLFLLQRTPQGLALARYTVSDPLSTRVLTHLPFGAYRFQPAPPEYLLLEETGRHRLLLISKSGEEAKIKLSVPALLWQWEPDGQRLLYSDGFDLHLYRPDAESDTIITRQSKRITSLAWHPEGSAVIFTQEDGLFAIELDTRDLLNTIKLESGQGFASVLVDDKGKNAYFIGTIKGSSGLYRRALQK